MDWNKKIKKPALHLVACILILGIGSIIMRACIDKVFAESEAGTYRVFIRNETGDNYDQIFCEEELKHGIVVWTIQ